MRIKLDNNIITNFDYHEGNSSTHDSVIVLTAIFDIGEEDNVSEAKLLSWNTNKEIKIEVTVIHMLQELQCIIRHNIE